jgi:hypothetical protein
LENVVAVVAAALSAQRTCRLTHPRARAGLSAALWKALLPEDGGGTSRSAGQSRLYTSLIGDLFTRNARRRVMHFEALTPKALKSSSPGLRGTSNPGKPSERRATRNGLKQGLGSKIQPLRGCHWVRLVPRVGAPASHQPWADRWNAVGVQSVQVHDTL